jgi:copper ion binding protein
MVVEKVTLVAPDITCGHCVSTIESAVGKLAGVRRVEGDPTSQRVVVTFDPERVNEQAIRRSMAEVGYPVAR